MSSDDSRLLSQQVGMVLSRAIIPKKHGVWGRVPYESPERYLRTIPLQRQPRLGPPIRFLAPAMSRT